MDDTYRYCPHCATPLSERTISDIARRACPSCGFVHWRNPIVGVAVIVRDDAGGVLLGRRSRSAYAGQWCIPCGYVEYDEAVREAAMREFLEETGLEVRLGEVYTVHSNFHNPRVHTVGIWFLGKAVGGVLHASDDLDAVAYVDPSQALAEYPLAFPTDRLVLAQLQDEARR